MRVVDNRFGAMSEGSKRQTKRANHGLKHAAIISHRYLFSTSWARRDLPVAWVERQFLPVQLAALDVMLRDPFDHRPVSLADFAHDFPRHAHHDRTVGDDFSRRHHGAGGNQAVPTNADAIEDDRTVRDER